MPIFEYKCVECKILIEKIAPTLEKSDPSVKCPRCEQQALRLEIPSSISLSRSSMDNAPIDNIIGKDADARWSDIHERQQIRNTARTQTGSAGLTEVGKNEFAPISEKSKETRTEVTASLKQAPKLDSGTDSSKSWLSTVD